MLGSEFVVKIDNVPNTFFLTQKKLLAKQARWQEMLAEYDFRWEHKLGRFNQVPDALNKIYFLTFCYNLTRLDDQGFSHVRYRLVAHIKGVVDSVTLMTTA